jgi:phage terminase large subunit-like protein
MQKHLVYGPGDFYGQRVRLQTFEKLFIAMLFELNPDGARRYKRAYLQCPKGNGKSELSSMIGLYMLAHQDSAKQTWWVNQPPQWTHQRGGSSTADSSAMLCTCPA